MEFTQTTAREAGQTTDRARVQSGQSGRSAQSGQSVQSVTGTGARSGHAGTGIGAQADMRAGTGIGAQAAAQAIGGTACTPT